jgi:cobalt-zinc-cadmium resistance protein CzcA
VPLSAVTDIPNQRRDEHRARERPRTTAIGIFIKDRDMGSVVADMKARVAKIDIPNYVVNWSGEFENQERAMKRLSVVVPISLLLIFVLLFDAFKSFKMASLILLNVPLALIGGFALWLTGIPLSVSAAIGFIALGPGRAQRRGDAVDLPAAARGRPHRAGGGAHRLDAAPAHRADDGDAGRAGPAADGAVARDRLETQRPLAIVVIGGLVTATLLTLVVLPSLYVSWFSRAGNIQGGDEAH